MAKLAIALLSICLHSTFAQAAALSSYSEQHDAPQVVPPQGLLQFILDSEPDDAALFNECLTANNLQKKSSAKLFIVSQANLTHTPNEIFFVRPALQPFCTAFYGAHLFRYWFVKVEPTGAKQKFSMLFKSGGDGISVLPQETKGYKDLRSISHTATELYTQELKFDGKKYQPASCALENYETKQTNPCK